VVEKLGAVGPRGGPLVSVAHYGELNGDLMADPEMVFELATVPKHPAWTPSVYRKATPDVLKGWPGCDTRTVLLPVYFRNAYMGVEQFAVEALGGGYYGGPYADKGAGWQFRPRLLRQLESFARTWDKNIKAQGFLKRLEEARVAA
jgi:hypothetical protein